MWGAHEADNLSTSRQSSGEQRRYDLWSLCATLAVASAVLFCGIGWSAGLIAATPLTALYFLGAAVFAFFVFGILLVFMSLRKQ